MGLCGRICWHVRAGSVCWVFCGSSPQFFQLSVSESFPRYITAVEVMSSSSFRVPCHRSDTLEVPAGPSVLSVSSSSWFRSTMASYPHQWRPKVISLRLFRAVGHGLSRYIVRGRVRRWVSCRFLGDSSPRDGVPHIISVRCIGAGSGVPAVIVLVALFGPGLGHQAPFSIRCCPRLSCQLA